MQLCELRITISMNQSLFFCRCFGECIFLLFDTQLQMYDDDNGSDDDDIAKYTVNLEELLASQAINREIRLTTDAVELLF